MGRRRTALAIVSLAGLAILSAVWLAWHRPGATDSLGLPGAVLSDAQMQSVWGGTGKKKEPKTNDDCKTEKGKTGNRLHISCAHGTAETDVPICTARSALGPTIDVVFHYNSGKADGSISYSQSVLGYGWTHNYNIHLIVRSRDVLMPDHTGTVAGFHLRSDGGYASSPGQTHTLSRVDADTFLLEKVDGSKLTFELFDPAPWPEAGELYQLTQIEDAQGRLMAFTYNAAGLLETITDPYGRQMGLTYNGNGRIETVTNADETVTQIEYQGADDDLWRITDPLGYTLEYTYDSQNRMTNEKLKDGSTWSCVYSGGGKPYQLIDGDGQVYATVANPVNWAIDLDYALQYNEVRYIPSQTTLTDARGNATTYHYDENGYITKTDNPDGTDNMYEFSDHLRAPRITDEEGNFWLYEYDEHGNTTKITDPLGNETQKFYEHLTIPKILTKLVEPDGDVWEYEYDPLGNLTKVIDPIIETPTDRVITYAYTYYPGPPEGRLQTKTRTDRNGHVRQWDYNSDGTLARETVDPAGVEVITEYEYDAAGRLTKQTVYRGPGAIDPVETTYEYDAMGQLTKEVVDPAGLNLTTTYEYDGVGRRIRVSNPRGVVTNYEYDVRGRLVTETVDPGALDLTTRYTYDGCDDLITLTDRNGNETTHEYNDRNRLVKTIDAEGYWTLYEYNARGNRTLLSRSVDRGSPPYRVLQHRYDELGRRTHEIVDPANLALTTTFVYAPVGGGCPCGTPDRPLVHQKTDPAGRVSYYYYDKHDRLMREVRKVGDTADNGGDADDGITAYTYDAMDHLVEEILDPGGLNMTTSYAYDAVGRLIEQVIDPGGESLTTSFEHNGAGNLIHVTTPVGNVVSRVYDKANRLIGLGDSIGTVVRYTYDENSNVLTRADGLAQIWTYTYDNADRRVTACDPLVEVPTDKCTNYQYDANGNLTQEVDNEGLETAYTYDGLDRRLSMTKEPGGLNITISYAYDGAGNQTRITDDNGNVTVYEYDGDNRLTLESFADGTERSFAYDEVGNITTRIDEMGNVTSYAFDDLHRLTVRTYADGSTDAFTYDRVDQLLTADNDYSHIAFAYDGAGRLTSSTQADLPQTYSCTVGYAYSTVPNTRTITYPSGKLVVEARDVRNRLTEVWQDAVETTWYTYEDPSNRILTKHFANGTRADIAHTSNDWVTELRHIGPDRITTFVGFSHDYDAVGNRLSARNLQQVIPYDDAKPATHSEKCAYDAIYRLTDYQRGQWVGGDIPAPRRHRTWQLDGVHNWEQFGINDLDTGETGVYCNSVNQMNEYDDPSNDGPPPVPDDDGLADDFMVRPCPAGPRLGDFETDGDVDLTDFGRFAAAMVGPGMPPGGGDFAVDLDGDGDADLGDFVLFQENFTGADVSGFNRAHDKNGNLIDDGVREYYYDYQTTMGSPLRAQNRLTRARDKATGEVLGQYWYDALGRRIGKLAGGISTVYVYTHDWRAIEEYEDGALARTYTYGDWIDEVLTTDRAVEADRFYYHANVLGSIVAVTDNAGAAVERYTYDAYGAPCFSDGGGNTREQSALGNPYLFTGRRYDPETGLYYCRTRYLEPASGRFTTRDLLGIWWDTGNLGSGYTYVGNNPWNRTDPTGEFWGIGTLIGAVAGAIAGGVTAAVTGGDVVAGAVGGAVTGALVGSGVPPTVAGAIGGAVGGAISGARGDPSNPVRGAIVGGAVGAAVGAITGTIGSSGTAAASSATRGVARAGLRRGLRIAARKAGTYEARRLAGRGAPKMLIRAGYRRGVREAYKRGAHQEAWKLFRESLQNDAVVLGLINDSSCNIIDRALQVPGDGQPVLKVHGDGKGRADDSDIGGDQGPPRRACGD